MKRPTQEQVISAALWLESNEGDERSACLAVAAWIQHEAREHWLRSEARKNGVSVARFRREVDAIVEKLK